MNPALTSIAAAAPAIAMLGMFACLIGGIALILVLVGLSIALLLRRIGGGDDTASQLEGA